MNKQEIKNNKSPSAIPAVISHQFTATYSSPLPPPEILAQYEKISPGLVQKIIELTEIQGNHRRELEAKKLEAEISHQKRRDCEAKIGQLCALFIAVSAIVGGTITAIYGYEWAGGLIGVSGIGGIVYTFVHGRKEKK
jgi:uncharacterized membrane protein